MRKLQEIQYAHFVQRVPYLIALIKSKKDLARIVQEAVVLKKNELRHCSVIVKRILNLPGVFLLLHSLQII